MRDRHFTSALCTVLAAALLAAAPIAADGAAGIHYERVPSPRLQENLDLEAIGEVPVPDFFGTIRPNSPMKPYGAPGVAIFDYDNDGDLDIYVTNGPRAYNSLYENSFAQNGTLAFSDVAVDAGVGAWDQDSTGVCYGDIDNDGDQDLYVLGVGEENRLFENRTANEADGPNGGAFFFDITAVSGTGGGDLNASVCSFGDFNNDGLLDLVVGNTFDSWEHMLPVFSREPYIGRQHNQLFLNQGDNLFVDASAVSGIQNVDHSFLEPDEFKEIPTLTWGIAAVDYDADGDTDIVWGDSGGYNRVFENDGTGFFTDRTHDFGLSAYHGSWMGFSFGDFNCDGTLDFFSTDLGNYLLRTVDTGASRWFLGGENGFTDPGLGAVVATPFGWGNVTTDYDNDGDTDIFFYGAMDLMSVNMADNPGSVLQNQGCGDFVYDFGALTRDHGPRVVEGVAAGDLNNDGFDDIVSAASLQIVPSGFYLPWPGILSPPLGSPMDEFAMFEGQWTSTDAGTLLFLHPERLAGDLAVEVSSGDNGNGWVKVDLLGGIGIAPGASVNRNGVGALILFTPEGGQTVMRPVTGGESYASANSLTATFGLGDAARGTVEVLWPGGTRNRLYDVEAGERVTIPEIPCSFDGDWKNQGHFASCHQKALASYKQAGHLTAAEKNRLRRSANRAYRASR